jgi:sec-independent protein translocase protein TatA
MFSKIGPWEIILVLAALLLLFGARKLPEIARSIGKSANEFKKGLKEGAESEPADSSKGGGAPKSSG